MRFNKIIFILLSYFSLFSLKSENIDSLINIIKTTKSDTTKVKALTKIGWSLMYRDQDSAIRLGYNCVVVAQHSGQNKFIGKSLSALGVYYWMKGRLDSAIDYQQKALDVFNKMKFPDGVATALGNMAAIYNDKGDFVNSISMFERAYKIVDSIGNKKSMSAISQNLASNYLKLGKFPLAFERYQQALKIAEEMKDVAQIALVTGNIGGVYYYTKDYNKALDYYQAALKLHHQLNNPMNIAREESNIGLCYMELNETDKALEYLHSAIEYREKMADSQGKASTLIHLGTAYNKKKDYLKAIEYFSQVIEISKKYGYIDMLSNATRNLGAVFYTLKQSDKAEKCFLSALNQDTVSGDLNAVKMDYSSLADLYYKSRKFEKAYKFFMKFRKIEDSLFNADKSKELGRKEASSEYERLQAVKEAEHKKELEKQEAIALIEKQRKNIWLILLSCVALGVGIIAVIIFSSLKVTKKQKLIIQEQKNMVEHKNREILDSITYAKRLQDAILVPEEALQLNFTDAFILYKPKDIVAGDFYWMHKLDDKRILMAVADCTGHGVPGAMVSIVCSNALSRSVIEFGLIHPDKILNKTRDLILETFSKNNADVKDGMDISICLIDKENYLVEWCGANNSLIYFAKNQMNEVKPDKQPVGKYYNPHPFTLHTLQLSKGDSLYLFTDGYSDQFGGPIGKKFKYKNMVNEFNKINDLPGNERKLHLEQVFVNWMGNLDQLDDICIIGIKI